jgi:flavin reductase (DIM6/NTAB) family NADH-FMN oxidoreductase RutF
MMTMSIDTAAPEFNRAFRDVLSSFCSGVTVITAMDGAQPAGFTCQSFFSVSIEPPLVAFSVAKTSRTYPLIRTAESCAINVLASDQEETSRAFGRSGADKWRGVSWHRSPENGNPIIDGVLAWIEGRIESEIDAGDHIIVVARILDMAVESEQNPLLFHRGAYLSA